MASTDRFGVVNFAKYEGDGKTVRLGRTVTDRTVIAAEGGLEIAGTRTSVGDVDGEEHGRTHRGGQRGRDRGRE